MIGDRRRKERASSTTLIFFERERFCWQIIKEFEGVLCSFLGGVSNVEVQKKNNRSPKQRPPALAGGVGNL